MSPFNERNITWKPLYDWQLKFRTENNLSIKKFIEIINYKTNNISDISYIEQCLGTYALRSAPSEKINSAGLELRNLIKDIKIK